MADVHPRQHHHGLHHQPHLNQPQPQEPAPSSQQQQQQQKQKSLSLARQVAASATAVTAGGSLLVLSALTLTGTVIALTLATPLLVIFSPVLVPAVITLFMLTTGFLASGSFGVAAVSVLTWIYRYVTSKQQAGGGEEMDEGQQKLGYKARELKEHHT